MRKFLALVVIVVGVFVLYKANIFESGTSGLPEGSETFDFTTQNSEIMTYINSNFNLKDKKGVIGYEDGISDSFIELSSSSSNMNYAYWGEASNNIPNGMGILLKLTQYKNNLIYSPHYIGYFVEGKKEGFGIAFSSASFDPYKQTDEIGVVYIRYEGMFKNNIYNGRGNMNTLPYILLKELSDASKWTESSTAFSNQIMTINVGYGCDFTNSAKQYSEQNKKAIDDYIVKLNDDKFNIYYCSLKKYPTVISYCGIFKDGAPINGKAFLNGKLCYIGGLTSNNFLGLLCFNGKGTLYAPDGNKLYSGKWNDGQMIK